VIAARRAEDFDGGPDGMTYKKDQGRLTRMAAFWSLAILIFYGCWSLREELSTRFAGADGKPVLGQPILGIRIPILGVDVTPALLIAAAVFTGAIIALHRWQQTPKVADLLIETETEMRKVTWPTFSEAVNSSVVVIVCVIFLMAFLAGADFLLSQWTTRLLTGARG
jgi:preprotein translocase SecE subunit